jgi:ubiquinone/menaquinone biosynthesis C-methylase UbiE
MVWIIVVVLAIIVLGSLPMKIRRQPEREGIQDAAAARAYDRVSHWPLFSIERRIILKALTQHRPQGILVDIGCGPGYLAAGISRRFPDLMVTGLDISDEMVRLAKRNWSSSYPGVEFLMGDAQRLPFPDNAVDFIVSSLSLHHWVDSRVAFREVHRVLKPGGQFLVFDLRRDAPRFFYYALKLGQALLAPRAIRRTNGAVGSFWSSYTPAEFKEVLIAAPWQELQIQSGLGWVLAWGSKEPYPEKVLKSFQQ